MLVSGHLCKTDQDIVHQVPVLPGQVADLHNAGRTGGQLDDQGPGIDINDLLPDLFKRPVAIVLAHIFDGH